MSTSDRRRKVWIALSDLFLDTDITSSLDWIEAELRASGYSVPELDGILCDEVAPVCLPNLYSVAGAWSGFDPDWMVPKIEANLTRPAWRASLGRPWRRAALRRMVPEWVGLRARLAR